MHRFSWIACKPGDFIQVPSGSKHAFRNRSAEPAISLVSTTAKLGHFFEEIGRRVSARDQSAIPMLEELQHFMEVAIRYGYWLATPEENAAAGIRLS
jgi:uncharacterized RmlC-like cupin family protein